MLMHLSTWIDIDAYLQRSKTILIPIGSTEQHGPNGLLGTDALCPEIIARRAAQSAEILIAPTFSVGCAQHHLAFAGSMTLRPSTMIATIVDWTHSLQCHGFENIYWLNGHGGNCDTVKAAFAELNAERSFAATEPSKPLKQKLRNWWDLPGIMSLCKQLYPIGHGMHATASEVAVTYAAYPDQVRDVEMTPKIAPVGTISDAATYRRDYPDGRIGSDPSQATPEDGERIIAAAAKALVDDFAAF
jgi:creatinine amidohydrolase